MASAAASGTSLARLLSSRAHLALRTAFLPKNAISSGGLTINRLHANLTVSATQTQFSRNTSSCRRPTLARASIGQVVLVANFSTGIPNNMSIPNEVDPVVSSEWLHSHLSNPNVKVIDASWYMPGDNRNPFEEYKSCHVPGALFFDVDGVVDPTTSLPHMLPNETAFAAAVSALGIQNSDTVVVYDGKGIFSAARVWWMFRTFGHKDIFVLDGGLPDWRAKGYNVESSTSLDLLSKISKASEVVKKTYKGEQVGASSFRAVYQPDLVWSLEQVQANINDANRVLVDARSKARFEGTVPEPRKGIRGGHVPGSKCVPFNEVLRDGKTLLEKEVLRSKFEDAGVPLLSPIVASCGTGVTACILALALHRLGKNDVAVYDGSWTEWGGLSETPVATHSG
ncbi:hypothetical protein KP509_14G038900 [Ceratopteris richardii]|uniref:Sulfurtransferase n=1 Tax=Ceratopteris richardii TaxID=49495 RepID=A0A8T2TE36_CERRI|nr:hypothetical protein KP509_14G038900 [Ceratopteris richardii]